MADQDLIQELCERVRVAAESSAPLCIRGGGTKDFYGRRSTATDVLDVGSHRGILSYEPTELVLTARCGTPLREVRAALAEKGQQLPFEPPAFGDEATLGGVVATGLAGPRRAFAGGVRDSLLGVRLLNGRGEALQFGGQVMKNVAGYDLSRLSAGAMGTLGVLLELSIKVLPKPAFERTVVFALDEEAALEQMKALARSPLVITATAYDGQSLYVRACGGERALEAAEKALGGDPLPESEAFWESVREQTHGFFASDLPLWRLSVPPATPALHLGPGFIEWGGAQRWVFSDAPAETMHTAASAHGGHATLFRGHDGAVEVFQPLPEKLMQIHRNVKQAIDPVGIFNPGRMFSEF